MTNYLYHYNFVQYPEWVPLAYAHFLFIFDNESLYICNVIYFQVYNKTDISILGIIRNNKQKNKYQFSGLCNYFILKLLDCTI